MTVSPARSGTIELHSASNPDYIVSPDSYPETITCFLGTPRLYAEASANSGYRFDHWSLEPDASGFSETSNPTNFILDEATTLVAYFTGGSGGEAPDPPENLSASDGTYTDRVYLAWNASSGATSYQIYRATSQTGTKSTLASGRTATNYSDLTVTTGVTYYYWVTAVNSYGTSGLSDPDTGYAEDEDEPVDPPDPPDPAYTPTSISVTKAKEMVDETRDLIIIDVSQRLNYESGHIFCAQNMAWNTFFGGEINYNPINDDIYKDMDILIYDHDGTDTQAAAEFLAAEGFSAVYYFPGGLTAWKNAGFEDVPSSCNCEICGLPPMALAGTDQTVNETDVVALDGSGSSDPSGGALTYLWTQFSGPDVSLDDPTDSQPSFTAPYVQEGGASLVFHLTVTNAAEESDMDSATVHVVWLSNPPVADAGSPQSVQENDPVTLDGSGSTDADDGIASFLWEQTDGTSVALTNAAAAVAAFTAPEISAAQETLTFRLTVKDLGGKEDTDTVDITVTEQERGKPVADAGADAEVNETHTATLDGSGSSSPEGAISRYEWTQLSGPTVTISNSTAVKTSFVAPAVGADTVLTFQLIVYDAADQASDPDEVRVTIINLGEKPFAHAGADQTLYEGTNVTLDGSLSEDPDGTISGYSWNQVSGPAASLSNPNAVNPGFTAPAVADAESELIFALTVTDNDGLEDTDEVTITVKASAPPVANAGPDVIVKAKKQVVLDGSLSSDPDDGIKSYTWLQTDGTAVTLSDPSAEKPEFTAPVVKKSDYLIFKLTVEDYSGNTSTDSVGINVKEESSGGGGGGCFINSLN